MAANKTKILKFVDGADPAKGGFLNVAELMHDVVKQMTDGGGFIVKHCSVADTVLNTVPWGVIDNTGTWVPGAKPPAVGSPPQGLHIETNVYSKSVNVLNSVSGAPRATITLEAGGPGVVTTGGSTPLTQAAWVDYLNPVTAPWTLPKTISTFSGNIVPNPADNGATGILTATNPVLGSIMVGQEVFGPGVTAGTTITALGSGTNVAGTYVVSTGQTVPEPLAITGASSAFSFNGSINRTVLTIFGTVTGTITYGTTISGSYVGAAGVASILPGTKIVSQLTATNAPAATTAAYGNLGDSSIVVSVATNVAAGQLVSGTGIPAGTFVKSTYTTGTTVDLVNSAGTAVTLTALLNGNVNFYVPKKSGTYVVDTSQYIPFIQGNIDLITRTTTSFSLLKQPYRVRFEILNNECVAAYVGTPLQLPGWSTLTGATKIPESWGIPGSVAKLTDPRGIVVDCAGAIGARQFVASCYTISAVTIGLTAAGSGGTATQIDASGNLTLTTNTLNFIVGTSITFSDPKCKQVTTSGGTVAATIATGTVAITYGTTYYVMRAASSATSIQITDSYSNALSGTATIFTASFITTGKFDLDASYSPGTGYSVGDVVYIKNPVLKMLANPLSTTSTTTVDVAFTGTSFFRVEATDSTGAVTAISVLNSGTLVRKEKLSTSDNARIPGSLTAGIPVTGTYYNYNTGIYYAGVANSGGGTTTTTSKAPGAIVGGGGSGLALTLTIAYSVPNVGPGAGGYVDEIDGYQGLYNRGLRVGTHGDSYPLKYYLSISNNGFFLGIFESNWATSVGGQGTLSKFTAAIKSGTPGQEVKVNANSDGVDPDYFLAPSGPPILFAQNVLGTITPGMLLTGDARIPGGTRILDYLDKALTPTSGTSKLIPDPNPGDGDAGIYTLSTDVPAKGGSAYALGYYNYGTKTVSGGKPTESALRNPPITLTGTSGDARFNWMLVQRPVNRNTGVILDDYASETSKHPVFCLNSVAGRYYHFTVRERDISHPQGGPPDHTSIAYYKDFIQYPTPGDYDVYPYRIPSGLNSEDSHALFNPQNQIALTEDKTYLITFPNNLTTPRFRYTEEIDMIGFTSSDIVMSGQLITFNTYDEPQDRLYIALPPSNRYNTGVRFCVLKQTGNI